MFESFTADVTQPQQLRAWRSVTATQSCTSPASSPKWPDSDASPIIDISGGAADKAESQSEVMPGEESTAIEGRIADLVNGRKREERLETS